jgi:opacity protein-like surface antigen
MFKVPPISATAEYGITDEISVGGYVATALSTVHFNTGAQSYNVGDIRHVIIGGRGLYHFDLLPSLDTYAGAMLGYNSVSTHDDGATTAQKSDITYTVMAGARYRLANTLGTFLELGYGVSVVNIGINLKFN